MSDETKKEKKVTMTCKHCHKKSKLDQSEIEGYLNWKCKHCYTITSFLMPFKYVFNCSMPTPGRSRGRNR